MNITHLDWHTTSVKVVNSKSKGVRVYPAYWKLDVDHYILDKMVEEFVKLGSIKSGQHIWINFNDARALFENEKLLWAKVKTYIENLYGAGIHDIDGALITKGSKVVLAAGSSLLFGTVVDTLPNFKVKVAVRCADYVANKVRNRTFMYPERIKVL